MNKSIVTGIFMESLQNWKTFEELNISNSSYSFEAEQKARKELEKEINDCERRFLDALGEKEVQ